MLRTGGRGLTLSKDVFLLLVPDSSPFLKALLSFQQSSAVGRRDNRWDTSVSVAANK